MRLSEIINPAAIRTGFVAGGRNKRAIIRDLVATLCKARDFDDEQREAIEEAILNREAQKPTGIGRGVAIPHGKTERVTGVCGLLAICTDGIEFQAADKIPARFVVLMVSDFNSSPEHVAALAQITRLLQRPEMAKKLAEGAPAQIHALLKQNESQLVV